MGLSYPIKVVEANFQNLKKTIHLRNVESMREYYTRTSRWTGLLAKPWTDISPEEYHALTLIYIHLLENEEAPYTNLLNFLSLLVDPRPDAPDQWDINLGKIAYMGQYLGDTISPYEMLAQMFGEPENLTKLQAMAKQWETFEKDPGIGGLMRSVIGSLSALVSTEGLEKTNKPNPLYLIEGYVRRNRLEDENRIGSTSGKH